MSQRALLQGTPARLIAVGFLLAAAATPASAEWFGDLYGGKAYTPRSDFTLVVGSPTGPADHVFHDVEWNRSNTFGARAGYWFDSVPWYGVALDIFSFDANVPSQTVDVTIQGATVPAQLKAIDLSANVVALDVVRLRYQFLGNSDYPKGRLQSYATAGPALFKLKMTNKENGELTNQPGTDSSVGYKVGAGLSWQVTQTGAIFGEFRFTHVRSEPVLTGAVTGQHVPVKFDLDTHHVVAGVSFRF